MAMENNAGGDGESSNFRAFHIKNEDSAIENEDSSLEKMMILGRPGAFKVLRLFRLSKMLRLARIQRILAKRVL